jgi:hypothetical protein
MTPAPGAATTTELPLRPQDELECRRCEVHCDKVVYPSACVDRACPFLYAFEEFGHTYIGCMQKVYGVEIDLELLREAEAQGQVGGLYPWFFSTSGVGTAVGEARRMGAEMAAELRREGVDGALLVAT